jgi:hypothetical protein
MIGQNTRVFDRYDIVNERDLRGGREAFGVRWARSWAK